MYMWDFFMCVCVCVCVYFTITYIDFIGKLLALFGIYYVHVHVCVYVCVCVAGCMYVSGGGMHKLAYMYIITFVGTCMYVGKGMWLCVVTK